MSDSECGGLFDETVEREFAFDLPQSVAAAVQAARVGKGEATLEPQLRIRLRGWERVFGDIVWRGARRMAYELLRRAGADEVRGRKALELGAGTGLLGALAAHLGAHAVMTDGDKAEMPTLHHNAELFRDDLGLGGSLQAAYLAWGTDSLSKAMEASPLLVQGGFDLIVGSDIVYLPEHIPPLAETIAFFLAENGTALIANTAVATRTNFAEAKEIFLKALEANGLSYEVEVPPDGPSFAEGKWCPTDYLVRITKPPSGDPVPVTRTE